VNVGAGAAGGTKRRESAEKNKGSRGKTG